MTMRCGPAAAADLIADLTVAAALLAGVAALGFEDELFDG
jgi:hypothetical protein